MFPVLDSYDVLHRQEQNIREMYLILTISFDDTWVIDVDETEELFDTLFNVGRQR